MEDRLRAALTDAMKARDFIARSAIRSTLAAIDNAGSIGVSNPHPKQRSGQIAGSVQGLGAGDAPRRELGDGEIIEIVQAQVRGRERAVEEYESLGKLDEAARLRSECKVLLGFLRKERPR
jgi:uncharacterized protein